ncbi:ribosome small subunit-dependent GTPase A [Geobacillus sp. C56-T2]|uniref:ribosome small subunit-dependent GTPase A n=1 Tax=Geobacillus sp. C56-T2 TaxID=600773 RepID=UPI00119F0633|nr:ribosome small subunit-dependent GTPase A [Geobacillus sp. C56-T2]NNV05065.1 ribosome small subunit-dependent GTPase A [Geobacillus sp. MMMUD3]TWG30031.1 ribosome biogenesis GTPase [Geobacillus sp. C56-T2]
MAEGQIMKALSGFYYVLSEGRVFQCRGRGVFRKQKVTPLVGDRVIFQATSETEGYILEIAERQNELVRPPIANVEQAILVFSAVQPDFSAKLLDRFLVLVESKNITPIIVISKTDLLDGETKETIARYVRDYRRIGYEVIETSAVTKGGLDELAARLRGRVSVVAGQSGVGKSSLLNALRPDLRLKTGDISSHLGRGRHTTRHVELLEVAGGLVADTPGFSALEFDHLTLDELPHYFPEFRVYGADCKFRGCLHVAEPKCAVREAAAAGDIAPYRYDHYLSFVAEMKERKPRY